MSLGYHGYWVSAAWNVTRPAGAPSDGAAMPDWRRCVRLRAMASGALGDGRSARTSFLVDRPEDPEEPSVSVLRERRFEFGVRRTRGSRSRIAWSCLRRSCRLTSTGRCLRPASSGAGGLVVHVSAPAWILGQRRTRRGDRGDRRSGAASLQGRRPTRRHLPVISVAYVPGVAAHHVLAIRASGGGTSGDPQVGRLFLLGGGESNRQPDRLWLRRDEPAARVCHDTFAGTHVALLNADYRFPVSSAPARVRRLAAVPAHDSRGAFRGRRSRLDGAFSAHDLKSSFGAELSARYGRFRLPAQSDGGRGVGPRRQPHGARRCDLVPARRLRVLVRGSDLYFNITQHVEIQNRTRPDRDFRLAPAGRAVARSAHEIAARPGLALVCSFGMILGVSQPGAQDRLPLMPGYDQYTRMQSQLQGAFVSGAAQNVQWADDGKSFTYVALGKRYRFDIDTMQTAEAPAPAPAAAGRGGAATRRCGTTGWPSAGRSRRARAGADRDARVADRRMSAGGPARGRQDECVLSPDGKLKAFYRARNFWVANADGSGEVQVTTDGSEAARIKNGSGSWVYGEELDQTTAIWWSPDSTKVGYYRFDESQVPDFYVADESDRDSKRRGRRGVSEGRRAESRSRKSSSTTSPPASPRRIDVRDGKPFDNDVVGHYVYNMRWSPDGTELLMNRTNRRQQIMEFVACSPSTAKCRVVVREEWPTGWIDNRPGLTWLQDQKRFIWESERNGWTNYYLLRSHRQADQSDHETHDLRVRRASSRSTKRPACCSTWRATATTT